MKVEFNFDLFKAEFKAILKEAIAEEIPLLCEKIKEILPHHTEKTYTTTEVGEILNRSKMQINRYISSGKLKSSGPVSKKIISESDLQDFLNKKSVYQFRNLKKDKSLPSHHFKNIF